jgi:riboflavin synthase
MFTGIVEELGTIASIERLPDAIRLTIRAERVLEGVARGDSISVNGCCLTVTDFSGNEDTGSVWTADVMAETLRKTSLGTASVGDQVNLERAVTPTTRLGGHIVQGHVDAVGSVRSRTPSEHWEVVEISVPAELSRYLVEKGSITVDGVSLTVVSIDSDHSADTTPSHGITVSLIPETLARTTLGLRQPGDLVNLEVDVIAKYVERLLAASHLEGHHD